MATAVDMSSSYDEALQAVEQLRRRHVALPERVYLSLMEKANLERRFGAVSKHFTQFLEDVRAGVVALPRLSDSRRPTQTSERVQMHRHVLWALFQGPPTTRYRRMQSFFRRHVQGKHNAMRILESDALNFLLRVECTMRFVTALNVSQGGHEASRTPATPDDAEDNDTDAVTVGDDSWLARVEAILAELRALRFYTTYSSSHALFHLLMRRPDVVLSGRPGIYTSEEQEDALQETLFHLLDTYPRPLERDPRRLSLAVSMAALAGRVSMAHALLQDAEKRGVAIDPSSFAHVMTASTDDAARQECADLYARAKRSDRLYNDDDENRHSMSNFLLLYAIQDGNFAQIMEILHEMEFKKTPALANGVAMLFRSFATYRAKHRGAAAASDCPTLVQLMHSFPTVLPRSTHVLSLAVKHALRAGDLEDALTVLRTTVWSTDVVLRPELFSQVQYALLVRGAATPREQEQLLEVEKLFDAQHPGQRHHLVAQLLNLCETNADVAAMFTVLDRFHTHENAASFPLSRRAIQRVMDTISGQLKALSEDEGARFAVDGVELSYRALLARYPLLFPLDAATLSSAIVRSATAGLADDVLTLHEAASRERVTLEPVAYKVVLESAMDASPDHVAEYADAMRALGVYNAVAARFPAVAARVEASQQ
ncbi:hypothetical protein P43SY_009479 [Pythium insidiosum]|uniref:Uncharacterized protein n=1 Tax=Pythium insidiosum TaxID=114742 RepID=A0AAD5Q835_PYTIN|nr:hypothetical protein P43SY_009479 [Pythium insidiosum]KAJ0397770.1 hypothetical protein ATCC90586_005606 [Pythium insidiosum]